MKKQHATVLYKDFFDAKASECENYNDVVALFIIDVTNNTMRVGGLGGNDGEDFANWFLNEFQKVNKNLTDLPTKEELAKKFWMIYDGNYELHSKLYKRE